MTSTRHIRRLSRFIVGMGVIGIAASALTAPGAQALPGDIGIGERAEDTFIGLPEGPGDRYIVNLTGSEGRLGAAQARVAASVRVKDLGGSVQASLSGPADALIVRLPSVASARSLAAASGVDSVVRDPRITTAYTQEPTPSWGLDRMDETGTTLDNSYSYPNSGTGVRVYVIDTGIRSDHVDFSGRILPGAYSIDDGREVEDCEGHGTHVSGTVLGRTHGVAKDAHLVPIRILDCYGGGHMGDFLVALEWIAKTHPRGVPAVINASLGGPYFEEVSDAIQWMTDRDFVVVVAAGNERSDACDASPAGSAAAMTVASIDAQGSRSYFSNFGSCVDIFAPGSLIRSAGIRSATDSVVLSGTSMASPHVAGLVASARERYPSYSAHQIIDLVLDAAIAGPVDDHRGSPQRIAHVLTGSPDAPAAPTATFDGVGIDVRWGYPVWDGGGVDSVTVEMSRDGGPFSVVATTPGTQTSFRTTSIATGTYSFKVTARNGYGTSASATTAPLPIGGDGPPEPTPDPDPEPGPGLAVAPRGEGRIVTAPRPSRRIAGAPRVSALLDESIRLLLPKAPARPRTTVRMDVLYSGAWVALGESRVRRNRSILLPGVTARDTGSHLVRIAAANGKPRFWIIEVASTTEEG